MKKLFFKYVLQNVAGMIGVSVYILADTFFISLYSGADGLTMLNLVIPIYGLMYAFGSMVGIGSAIRYALKKASGDENTDFYFTHALSWDLILSIPFILLGIFAPQWVLHLMGADARIAAYGVIANISIVALSIFNGISQGTQPLISETYGSGKTQQTKKLLKAGLLLTLVAEIFVVAAVWILSEPLIQLFNSEGNALLVSYAQPGMKLYFSGFFIAGINLMLISYFAATDRAVLSFLSSILRGVIAIVLCAVVLSRIWGMTGIWLAFLTSELITLGITILVQGIAKKRAAY